MEEAGAYEGSDHHAPIYAARSRRGTDSSSVDGWLAGAQSTRGQLPNGPEPPYASPYGSQQPSPPSQPNFFLPPGARPPSPGYNTPPPRMSHMSQNNLANIPTLPPSATGGYPGEIDAYASGRSRGYSSASQSDHERGGGQTPGPPGGGGGTGGGNVHHSGMLNKPPQSTQAGRSPLAQSYSSDMGKPQPPIPDMPTQKEKEKKKGGFWSRVGGDRKSKDAKDSRNKESLDRLPTAFATQLPRASMDDVRPSADDYREGSIHGQAPPSIQGGNHGSIHGGRAPSAHGHTASSVGHGFEESRLRSRGIDLGLHLRRDDGPDEDDVSAAVSEFRV